MNQRIVVIGGGTGVFTLLTGLKKYTENLTAVVNMADSGGSTGVLREEFGVLPPGDIRRALIALSDKNSKTLADLFAYRFEEESSLHGHSFGNLFLAALERITGDFEKGIAEAKNVLSVRGEVIPVTTVQTNLCAQLEDSAIIRGETNIDIPKHDGNLAIVRAWLEPRPPLNPRVKEAIAKADIVVIGPGDLYTSIVPNLLARGMEDALKKTDATVTYVTNVMTKFGETNGFRASDFVHTVCEYAGGADVIDRVIVPDKKPSEERLAPYAKENAEWVEVDEDGFPGIECVRADVVRDGPFIRHDPDKLAQVIVRCQSANVMPSADLP